MSIYEPEAVTVQGQVKVVFCTTIADPEAPDLSTEIGAVTSVEATLAMDQWKPTNNVNTGNAKARLGTRVQQPVEGNVQRQPIPLVYPHHPELDLADALNKLKSYLARNEIRYAVVRRGIDIDTPFTAGDLVEVWKIRCGFQSEEESGDGNSDEFAQFEIHQNVYPLVNKVDGVIAA